MLQSFHVMHVAICSATLQSLTSPVQNHATNEMKLDISAFLACPSVHNCRVSVREVDLSIIADAPCAQECTRELYPWQDDFNPCYSCGKAHPFEQPELGSIEFVFEINYTRSSLLLGGVQSTLATTCVSLLEEEGMKVCRPCICLTATCVHALANLRPGESMPAGTASSSGAGDHILGICRSGWSGPHSGCFLQQSPCPSICLWILSHCDTLHGRCWLR